jgi:pimeloyl-ACP methyl ester carboxylesterase
MERSSFDELYCDAPPEQRELLRDFRATHPYQHTSVNGVAWEYIASGQGEQAVLILGGGLSVGESSFRNILRLEKKYRVLSPSYPPVGKLGPVADGLSAILQEQGFAKAHILGHSLGAGVGHAFIRMQPDSVDKLVLNAFGLYTPAHVRSAKLFLKLPVGLLLAYYRRTFKRLLAQAEDADQRFYAIYTNEVMTHLHTPQTLKGQFKLLMDISDNAEKYGVFRSVERAGKVLLVLAEDDKGFTAEERQALKDTYPGAQIHSFASGGHLAAFQRRTEFDAVVDAFLDAP